MADSERNRRIETSVALRSRCQAVHGGCSQGMRQMRADKRGTISGPPSVVLNRLGYRPSSWVRQVQAVKSESADCDGLP